MLKDETAHMQGSAHTGGRAPTTFLTTTQATLTTIYFTVEEITEYYI